MSENGASEAENRPEISAHHEAPLPAGGKRPRIVIIGAGFGGIETARALRGLPADVLLIDRNNYHCFQPLLYQVASAALSPAHIAWPVRGVLSGQSNLTVLMAAVTGVDTTARRVLLGGDSVPYDYLVLATGATHSYFGHDDWARVAPGLKKIEDATRIRREILIAFERAELCDSAEERRHFLTFVIIGGGPTGVELAGSIAEVARHALPDDFRRVDPRTARILLVEAGPRVLPTMPPALSDYARERLETMGVDVLTNVRVISCDADGVDTEPNGRIRSETIIWAAGVRASPAAGWIGAEADRAGRVRVTPELSVPGLPEVFAIGDTALFEQDGKPVPGIAPAAKQMGQHVGRLLKARVTGAKPPAPFRYSHAGDLATIGRNAAVVKLGRLELKGFPGWLFWSVVHVYFLIGARNRLSVAFHWLWNYVTRQRGARLITGDDPEA